MNRDGCHMWDSKCSLFLEHLISLPFGSSRFHPFMIYTLQNLSVLGLCLRIDDSGLFSWISQVALSRTYFIIAARQDGPSLNIEEPQPTPHQKAQFYSLLYIYRIVMFISQYIGTPGSDVTAPSHLIFELFWITSMS